jgi:hypothetical protein
MNLLTSFALQGAHYELQRRVRELSNESYVCQTSLSNCVVDQNRAQLVGAEYQQLVAAVEGVFYRNHATSSGLTPDQMVAILANEHQQLVDAVADLIPAPGGKTPLEMVEDAKQGIASERGRLQALVTRSDTCDTMLVGCNSEHQNLIAAIVDLWSAQGGASDGRTPLEMVDGVKQGIAREQGRLQALATRSDTCDTLLADCNSEHQRLENEHQNLVNAIVDLWSAQGGASDGRTPLEMVDGVKQGIAREQGRLQALATRSDTCDTLLADCNSERQRLEENDDVKKILDDFAVFLDDRSRLQKGILADALDVSVEFEKLVVSQAISYTMSLEETLKSFLRLCGVNDVGDRDFISPVAADSQGRNLAVILCEDLANGIEGLRRVVNDDDAFEDTLAGGSYYFSGIGDLRSISDIVSGKLTRLHLLEDQVRDLQLQKGQDCDIVRELLSACAKEKTALEEQLNGNAVRRYPQYPLAINRIIIALADIAHSKDDVIVDSVARHRYQGLISKAAGQIPAVKTLLG